jgi:hypothetical protein
MENTKRLPPQSYEANKDTGSRLDLELVPATANGLINHITEIVLDVEGEVVFAANVAAVHVCPVQMVKQVVLDLPGIREVINFSGPELVAMYRLRNRGEYPQGSWAGVTTTEVFDGKSVAAVAAAAVAFKFEIPIQFADPEATESDDDEWPAELLHGATFTVFWDNDDSIKLNTSAVCAVTSLEATLIVTVHCSPREEMNIPNLVIFRSLQIDTTEPKLDSASGLITHGAIIAETGAAMAAADLVKLGLSFGTYRVSEDGLETRHFYRRFNRGARVQLVRHTDGSNSLRRTALLPIIAPPNNKQGQRLSVDVVDGRRKMVMKADAISQTYRLIQRVKLFHGPWTPAIRSHLGIPANAVIRSATSNGKPPKNAMIAASTPFRVKA